mgnify:FL=1
MTAVVDKIALARIALGIEKVGCSNCRWHREEGTLEMGSCAEPEYVATKTPNCQSGPFEKWAPRYYDGT